MKLVLLIVLMNAALISCVTAGGKVQPVLNRQAFPGFDFNQSMSSKHQTLTGYQYQTVSGDSVDIHSCKQARDTDSATIAEFEYFRFQQLLVSCEAIEQFSGASASEVSHFPTTPDPEFYQSLPASIAPLLSKSDLAQRQGKSFLVYDDDIRATMENPMTAKLLTDEDEIYITLLARGDFTDDGIEDLLVKTEWYARKAHGKHLDLIVLSKTGNRQAPHIEWRMKAIK